MKGDFYVAKHMKKWSGGPFLSHQEKDVFNSMKNKKNVTKRKSNVLDIENKNVSTYHDGFVLFELHYLLLCRKGGY